MSVDDGQEYSASKESSRVTGNAGESLFTTSQYSSGPGGGAVAQSLLGEKVDFRRSLCKIVGAIA